MRAREQILDSLHMIRNGRATPQTSTASLLVLLVELQLDTREILIDLTYQLAEEIHRRKTME